MDIGEEAPASKTPKAVEVGGDLSKLSTDQHPDPAFYRTSVKDALAAGKPFVLVFATPLYCSSRTCGRERMVTVTRGGTPPRVMLTAGRPQITACVPRCRRPTRSLARW